MIIIQIIGVIVLISVIGVILNAIFAPETGYIDPDRLDRIERENYEPQ